MRLLHHESQTTQLVIEALADTRVVFVMGARHVGKSTLTHGIAAHDHPSQVLTLDDKTTRDAAVADPTAFVAGLPGPVLIDEVQRAPDLLLAIKDAVDRDRRPGRFLLTGSANILTAPKVAEALTGRIEIVELWPLSQTEIEESGANFVDAVFEAAPPKIVHAPIGREAFVERAAQGGPGKFIPCRARHLHRCTDRPAVRSHLGHARERTLGSLRRDVTRGTRSGGGA